MSEFEKKLLAYSEMFSDNFPLFAVRGLSEPEVIALLDKCMSSGTPYVPDYSDDDY